MLCERLFLSWWTWPSVKRSFIKIARITPIKADCNHISSKMRELSIAWCVHSWSARVALWSTMINNVNRAKLVFLPWVTRLSECDKRRLYCLGQPWLSFLDFVQILQRIEGVDERNKLLVTKYKKEMALRKKFHNELVDLKGNIRVFCRVRPVIREDGGGKLSENVVSYDDDDDAVLNILSKGTLKTFEMDKVFNPQSTQEEVRCASLFMTLI